MSKVTDSDFNLFIWIYNKYVDYAFTTDDQTMAIFSVDGDKFLKALAMFGYTFLPYSTLLQHSFLMKKRARLPADHALLKLND